MTRKREVERPYRPAYCSAETLAYLLDISRDTLAEYVRLGHLPAPVMIGPQRKWRWQDVDAYILARNGRDAEPAPALPSEADDAFEQGIASAKSRTPAHA